MFTISSLAFSRLLNTEFVAYFIQFQKSLNEFNYSGDTPIVTDSVVTQFDNKLVELTDKVYAPRKKSYTVELANADAARCAIYRRLIYKLKGVLSPGSNTAILACAETVKAEILSGYDLSVLRLPYQERTAVIKGFLYDLTNKLDSSARMALVLQSDMDALDNANENFIAAYQTKLSTRYVDSSKTTLILRAEMIDIYTAVKALIEVAANDDTNANTASAQEFVDVANIHIAEVAVRLKARLSGTTVTTSVTDEETGVITKTSVHPDGTTHFYVIQPDGSYKVTYVDLDNNVTVTYYNAAGEETDEAGNVLNPSQADAAADAAAASGNPVA